VAKKSVALPFGISESWYASH